MKLLTTSLLCAAALSLAATNASAAMDFDFNTGFANGGTVPDGNASGWSDTRTLSGLAGTSITDVQVRLHISGGYNGDYYAYLTHETGRSVLLNRVGRDMMNPFGYGDAGFNVTFDDAAANGDFHLYQEAPMYQTMIGDGSRWQPDARDTDPMLTLTGDARTHQLSAFDGMDPNGDWTLFVADLGNGEVGSVQSWGMTVSAVPEPANVALAIAGGLFVLSRLPSYLRKRRASQAHVNVE